MTTTTNETWVLVWASSEPQEPADHVPAVCGVFPSLDEALRALVENHNDTCDEDEELSVPQLDDQPRLDETTWDLGYGVWSVQKV